MELLLAGIIIGMLIGKMAPDVVMNLRRLSLSNAEICRLGACVSGFWGDVFSSRCVRACRQAQP